MLQSENIDLRRLLAQCCRMLEVNGLIDFSGHVSGRSNEQTFLINPYSQSRSIVRPEDMVEVRLDGTPLDQGSALPSEVYIHSAIYQARSDVRAIAHLHSPAVISLSVARQPIFPAIYQGSIFADGIPVYEDARLVNTAARGEQLARTLGRARAVVIRGHGSVVVAESVKALFFACIYFERNAQRLMEAYQMGRPEPLSQEEMQEGRISLWREELFAKVWNYYASKLEPPEL